jgi:hypothetical protein
MSRSTRRGRTVGSSSTARSGSWLRRDLLCDFLSWVGDGSDLVWSGSHDLFGWFQVYDVTKFLEDHPGGEDALLHASGELRLLLLVFGFCSLSIDFLICGEQIEPVAMARGIALF